MPSKSTALLYLASLLADSGMTDQAIANYREAVSLDPDNAAGHNDLGFMLFEQGDIDAAIQHYEEAVRVRPNLVQALGNLAYANLRRNRLNDALFYFKQTLRVRPDVAESHYNIGDIYFKQAQFAPAAVHLKEALRLDPNRVQALNTLAWVLATADDGKTKDPGSAVALAQKASALTGDRDPVLLCTLAVAYAAADQSIAFNQTAEKALRIARESDRQDIVEMIEKQIRSF